MARVAGFGPDSRTVAVSPIGYAGVGPIGYAAPPPAPTSPPCPCLFAPIRPPLRLFPAHLFPCFICCQPFQARVFPPPISRKNGAAWVTTHGPQPPVSTLHLVLQYSLIREPRSGATSSIQSRAGPQRTPQKRKALAVPVPICTPPPKKKLSGRAPRKSASGPRRAARLKYATRTFFGVLGLAWAPVCLLPTPRVVERTWLDSARAPQWVRMGRAVPAT